MAKPDEQLKTKLSQFEEEFNTYSAFSVEKQRQESAAFSGSGICITNFIDLESKLIGQYFNGFENLNGIYVKGNNRIYEEYFKAKKYRIKDDEIIKLKSNLTEYWQHRVIGIIELLKRTYSAPSDAYYNNQMAEFKLNSTYIFEIGRLITDLNDLKLSNSKTILSKAIAIFVPVGSAIGFLTGTIQFYSAAHPYWLKLIAKIQTIIK